MNETKPQLRETELTILRAVFSRYPAVQRVILYGSRAEGRAKRGSDIDLAVDAPDATDTEFAKLWFDLEESELIFTPDVHRLDSFRSKGILENIEKHGIEIYRRV